MSEMLVCPACNGDGYARPRDHEAEVPNHTPMQPDELRALNEEYLRENGWKWLDRRPKPQWLDPTEPYSYTLSGALNIQWARDGIGGAS